MQKVVYVAGAMTGYDDFNYDNFDKPTKELMKNGFTVLSPHYLPDTMSPDRYLPICLKMVEQCDIIYMLKGWQHSAGARAEISHAILLDKRIVLEEDEINIREFV